MNAPKVSYSYTLDGAFHNHAPPFFFNSAGLNLELNIEQDEYLGSFAPEAGARLDITNQGYMPFPFERGLSLAPGFATAIGLRKVNEL